MKILIVSTHPSHPAIEGNRRFIYNQIELFKQMGHDVYFLLIQRGNRDWGNSVEDVKKSMNEYWDEHFSIFKVSNLEITIFNKVQGYRKHFYNGYLKCDDLYPKGLNNYVKKLNEKHHFDACIINYYFLSKLFCGVTFPLMAINTHDYFGYKNLLTGEENVWLGTTPNEEAKALQRCPHIFALNTEEAVYFSKLSPQSTVYNIFSIYKYRSSETVGNHKLLFLSGNNIYNQNGLNWFLKDIFPAIVKRFPDCTLEIGGGICNVLKGSTSDSHVKLLGFVDSSELFYDRADVVINPTYQGTGLKIKTFEGISNGKIVMAHPHSLIGIYKPESAPLFSSANSEDWVLFLEHIWNDSRQINAIKVQCKSYVKQMNDFVKNEYSRFFNIYKTYR